MSNTITLRDHTQPCEHGTLRSHDFWKRTDSSHWNLDPFTSRGANQMMVWCPGGRERTAKRVPGEALLADEYYWVLSEVSDE